MERDILLLGNPRLYEISEEVKREELEELRSVFTDMFDCIRGIRRDYGFGRAIAAPQIGVQKRLICILTDQPYVIINPRLEFVGNEMMELMDDCMSFPNLLAVSYTHLDVYKRQSCDSCYIRCAGTGDHSGARRSAYVCFGIERGSGACAFGNSKRTSWKSRK